MTPWVKRLLIANIVMFFLQQTLPVYARYLVLYPDMYLLVRMPWTLITYMFLHGSFMHIGFNMLVLFFFGPRIEARLGSRHFIWLYMLSGVAGGVLSIILSPAAIIGASAATYGVMFTFARFWPHERIYIWGVLPVEARMLVIIATVASLWGGFGVWGSGIAHFAHLGGFVGAWLYLKWMERNAPSRKFRERATPGIPKGRSEAADLRRWATIPRDELHPLNREEVERIYQKIETSGVRSLTIEERASLDRFSRETG
ncbi:MAG TPA: rhomboid family intramembrane serine protease [Gemmatimonadaceae bacterium]|nr:rhomboid family intramembrane serine protease [Gemmatimonadaceae bacterium]